MSLLLAFKALFLGIIEGLTEFLPISSTGHLIVAGSLIGFDAESHAVFNIAIQLGAILAVVYEYRARFIHVATHIGKDRLSNRFVLNLAIAFIPAAVIGLLFNDFIEKVRAERGMPAPAPRTMVRSRGAAIAGQANR